MNMSLNLSKFRKSLLWLSLLVVGFFLLLGGQSLQAKAFTTNPTPTRQYVVDDYDHILSPQTKRMVINKEKEYKNTYARPQVVVMTVPDTNGESIDDYADDLLANQRWHFGNKQYNNGVLLLYSEDGRHVRISTGYGVEDLLPDVKTHDFLEQNEDELKSGSGTDINTGLQNTFSQITNVLDKRYAHMSKAQLQAMARKKRREKRTEHILIAIIIIAILAVLFWPHGHDDDHWHEDDHHMLWDCLFWSWMFGDRPGETGLWNTPTDDDGDDGGLFGGSSGGDSFGGFSDIGGGGGFGGGGSSI